MPDSLIIDVAIGLGFTFAVFAGLTSALTEVVTRFLGLRGDYLLRGIRALVDGEATPAGLAGWEQRRAGPQTSLWGAVGGDAGRRTAAGRPAHLPISDPQTRGARATADPPGGDSAAAPLSSEVLLSNAILGNQGMKNLMPAPGVRLTRAMKRELPSYISGRSFASAILALVVPDTAGSTTMDELVEETATLPDGVLKKSLQSLAASSSGDLDRFRDSIAGWYDDHMARVSGWYKRHVRWISIAIGAVLVLGANVSAIALSRALYSDQAIRETVVTQAVASSNCSSKDAATCINQARKAIANLHAGGLPIGWGAVAQCQGKGSSCNWLQRYGLTSTSRWAVRQVLSSLLLVLGWALTALALMPGARFWFDILSKLGTLRSSGPKPAST